MKKDAFYFPHFSNARNDRKIRRLRKELSIEGYGIYFMLLEILRENEYIYPLQDIDLLADDFGTSTAKVKAVIVNYQLFEIDQDNMFFSIKLNEYMQPYLKMKEQRRQAGIASAKKRKQLKENSTTVQRPLNDRITTVQQSKVKESKVKEMVVNENFNETTNTIIFQFENVKKEILKDQIYIDKFNKTDKQINLLLDQFLNQIEDEFEDDGTPCRYRPLGRHKSHFKNWIKKQTEKAKLNGYINNNGKKVSIT